MVGTDGRHGGTRALVTMAFSVILGILGLFLSGDGCGSMAKQRCSLSKILWLFRKRCEGGQARQDKPLVGCSTERSGAHQVVTAGREGRGRNDQEEKSRT